MDLPSRKPRYHRVRTGCVTCKARKVKCSEEQPFCQRCIASGRKCGGYNVPRTWLFEPNQSRADLSDAIIESVDRPPSTTYSHLPNVHDRRTFNLYINQTVPLLSAYFGHSFWAQTLPQVAFHEPIIMRMVLAISSLIESTEMHYMVLEDNAVYQSHYRNVIARMTCKEPPSIACVLMICVLLGCCDFFRGNFAVGMNHITSGARILDEWFRTKYRKSKVTLTEANLILAEVAPLLASILRKAPTYGVPVSLVSEMRLKLSPSLELPYIPKEFSSIHQARHSLDGLAHVIVKLIDVHCEDIPSSGPLVPQLRTFVSSYGEALRSFEAQLPPLTIHRLAIWLRLFRAHHQVLSVIISTYPVNHLQQTCYEQFMHNFILIIDQYKKIEPDLELLRTTHNPHGPQWHAGFIPPLFFVATKCHDRQVQAEAISHLRSLRFQEKNWNSCIAAEIATRLVQLEEQSPFRRDHDQHRSSLARESDLEVSNWDTERVSVVVSEIENALRLSLLDENGVLDCPCNGSLDWQEVTYLVRRSGYQGATLPVPTECRCSRKLLNISPGTSR
ncbi:hypothetical protein F4859DRAFT_299088 [Xylaria cf. heliscus]|nr:hypothetical protein F4859DRAFT_299088 [Xylaria cf. heliscus]